jgi:O-6-methylguanine DNA methyltransferase
VANLKGVVPHRGPDEEVCNSQGRPRVSGSMSFVAAFEWAVFETPLGWGGIVWNPTGITYVLLPEPDRARVAAKLKRRFQLGEDSVPPARIDHAIEAMQGLLRGESRDLSDIELDMAGVEPFDARVYALARLISVGETRTYGQIATRLGDVRLAREVGQALGRNPFPLVVPCHRVVAANGKLGGFSARGGVNTKQRLLEIEQANVSWQLSLEV